MHAQRIPASWMRTGGSDAGSLSLAPAQTLLSLGSQPTPWNIPASVIGGMSAQRPKTLEFELTEAGGCNPGGDDALRGLAQRVAKAGEVFLSFTDSNCMDAALSWAHRAHEVGIDNIVIGVMDLMAEAVSGRGRGSAWLLPGVSPRSLEPKRGRVAAIERP